jgi:hypothetical protein
MATEARIYMASPLGFSQARPLRAPPRESGGTIVERYEDLEPTLAALRGGIA